MSLEHLRGGVALVGTATELATANPVLLERQLSLETDTGVEKIGDGTTHYNSLTALPGGGGGGGASGSGTPVGVVTPTGVGAQYTDTSNGCLFIAIGPTDQDWVGYGQNDAVGGFADARGYYAGPGYAGNLIVCEPGEDILISDLWSDGPDGTSDGIQWIAGNSDGQSSARIQANRHQWQFKEDGAFRMTTGGGATVAIYPTADVPDDSVGQDGDWCLSANGHFYFKTSGAWVEKV